MESDLTPSLDEARARFLLHPIGALAAVSLVLVATPAAAQESFPARPIQIIVPTGPGGGTDTAARLIARNLSERLKWQVVVINRLGAGTRLASESVAKRPLSVEQVPRALARGCDPVAGCKRRT
jgi:hypothetical protein